MLQALPFRAEGAITGTVCIAQVTDTECPVSPPVFNGPLTTPNTLVRIPIMINNTAPFIGFDIALNSSDVSKLRPYGADLTGSIMPTGSIRLTECIGGVLITGASCPSADNPSTVHLAVVGPFGFLSPPGATGLLFTAIFSIIGTTAPGGVTIGYQNGCDPGSSSNGNLCVALSNGTVTPVPESTQTGGFDNSDTTVLAYATLSTTAASLGSSLAGAPTHSLPTTTFSAMSQNGFNTTSTAQLSLAATINGTGIRPTVSLSAPIIDLTGVSQQTFTQTGTVPTNVPAGVYIATVTATYQTQDMVTFTTSSLSAAFSLQLAITDYSLGLNQTTISILAPGVKPVAVIVAPKAGFSGLVRLGVAIPATASSAGIGASLSTYTISGGTGTSILTVTTTASTPSGTFTLMINSNTTLNGFTRAHAAMLTVGVGSASDFQISANPSTLSAAPGYGMTSTITVISLNGFAGPVALSFAVTPVSGLSCSLSSTIISLNFTISGTSILSCAGSIGTYTVTITGSGGGHSHSASVSVIVVPVGQGTVVAVDPYATIDLARASKTITIAVNLTGSPSINGVAVTIEYDYHVLHASNLNYSTNVLSQTIYPTALVRDCLDGISAIAGQNGLCGPDDGPGVVSFAQTILGGATANSTQGNIFFLTLSVNTTAPNFSQIQIKQYSLALAGSSIPATVHDGYYTSLSCNGSPCTPPKADFTWSPLNPTANQVITLHGNASLPSPGAVITDYFWTFGDTFSPLPVRDSGANSTTAYLYQFAGKYSVTLRITDSNGLKWSKTILLTVIPSKPPNDFTLSGPGFVSINPGQNFTYSDGIQATSFGLTGAVSLSAISPQGLTLSFNPSILTLGPATSAFSSMSITASSTILPGDYGVIIIGTAGILSHNVTATVRVLAPNFALSVSPHQITITSGSSTTVLVALITSNLNTTVTLSSPQNTGSPAPAPNSAFNISFAPTNVAIFPGKYFFSTMLIKPYSTTPPGTYLVFVVGSNGFLSGLDIVSVTVVGPPDFTIQTYPPTIQVLAGFTGLLGVNVERSPCCTGPLPPFNVTLSVSISPLVPNGPRVSLRDTILTIYGGSYTSVIILTGPNTPPGNYTLTVTGRSGSLIHLTTSTLVVFPPPVLRVTPPSGPVGTKVQINGSGFILFQPGYYPQNQAFWVTFDDQFLGEAFASNSSFVFTFNVPHAQPGPHLIKALGLVTGVNATAPFQVLAEPTPLTVSIDTGTIYFPGDTATVYVLIFQNGLAIQAPSIQIHLTLIKPDGSNVSLTVKGVSGGLFMAVYAVPTTGPIGTYALLATAQGPNSALGTALHTFEVKPSWLSSKSQTLVSATGAIGAIGLVAFAWKKGYLRRKQGDQEIFA